LARGGGSGKIGITARQPFLGKLEWIKEAVRKAKSEAEQEAARQAKEQEQPE